MEIDEREDSQANAAVGWYNLSDALIQVGRLRDTHHAALTALSLSRELDNQFREANSLQLLGTVLAVSGVGPDSEAALQRSIRLNTETNQLQSQGVGTAYLGERALWFGDPEQARQHADRAWELAHHDRHERDFIRAARIQGTAALALDDLDTANERLHHALNRARATNNVEEELPTLIALAELHHRQDQTNQAREHLNTITEPATRGPYPTHHANAQNQLARIELDTGNHPAAITAATHAYHLAWCDGPPYTSAHTLQTAANLLNQLNTPPPQPPPFNPNNHQPLPHTDINPQ
ncbi:MAG: hypothetical protein GY939_00935 [Actinomycetia bacterium]|nr:hypothetical protein [Actinomycetes bacterium]